MEVVEVVTLGIVLVLVIVGALVLAASGGNTTLMSWIPALLTRLMYEEEYYSED